VADYTKTKEFLTFLNDKFKLTQSGPIRDKIWSNKTVSVLDDGQYPKAVFLKTLNNKVLSQQVDAINVLNWGVKEKESGKIAFN